MFDNIGSKEMGRIMIVLAVFVVIAYLLGMWLLKL